MSYIWKESVHYCATGIDTWFLVIGNVVDSVSWLHFNQPTTNWMTCMQLHAEQILYSNWLYKGAFVIPQWSPTSCVLTFYSCRIGCRTICRATFIPSSYSYSVQSVWVQWSSFSRGDTWTEHITVGKCSIRLSQWNADLQWVTGNSGKPNPHNGATVWDTWTIYI